MVRNNLTRFGRSLFKKRFRFGKPAEKVFRIGVVSAKTGKKLVLPYATATKRQAIREADAWVKRGNKVIIRATKVSQKTLPVLRTR